MLLSLPNDIIFKILEFTFYSEFKLIENDSSNGDNINDYIDIRSFYYNYPILYNYDNYIAYYLCILSQLNKYSYNIFKNDIYWKPILTHNNIIYNKKTKYKSKYLQNIILNYYKKIIKYYKTKIKCEHLYLKANERNMQIILNADIINTNNNKEINNKIIFIKGYWFVKLKPFTQLNNINNWYTLEYITFLNNNRVYEWEKYTRTRLKTQYNDNILYYNNELIYFEEQYKNIIQILNY